RGCASLDAGKLSGPQTLAELDVMTDLQASASAPEEAPAPDAAAPWNHLPSELLLRVVAFLPLNELACTARLVCKATAVALSGPQDTTVRMSQPSPRDEFVRRWGRPGAMRPLTLVRRRLLLSLTAASGCLQNLQWLAPHVGCSLTVEVFAAAAAAGRLDACRWLQQQGCYKQWWPLSAVTAAAGAGQRAMEEWLLANTGKPDGIDLNCVGNRTRLACSAARGGHVGLMDWLLQRHGRLLNGDAAATVLVAAAEGCDLPTLQRLYHTYPQIAPGYWSDHLGCALSVAASSPTPDWKAKATWLEGQGAAASASNGTCARAAFHSDALDRLTWLRGRGYPWDWNVTESAAVAGNLDALRYLLAEGCPVREATLEAAAGAGQLASLQALHAHGSTLLAPAACFTAVASSARGGHLPVVAWLREQQLVSIASLQRRSSLLLEATKSGSVELLAWLRDLNCPWGADNFPCAAEAGSEEVLEWLVAQGCPMQEPRGRDDDPYLTAARQGDWGTLACLRRLGFPWRALNWGGGTFVNAVWEGCAVPILRRLLELGCPVDWGSAIEKAAFVDAGVLAWLQEEQRRRDWEREAGKYGAVGSGSPSLQQPPPRMFEAAGSGSVELLAWLRDPGCPWGEDISTTLLVGS
ncbi:hypothetical protein TSOC_006646, partial [Tetrabaena socialis]